MLRVIVFKKDAEEKSIFEHVQMNKRHPYSIPKHFPGFFADLLSAGIAEKWELFKRDMYTMINETCS